MHIAVYGAGYVGLVSALCFAKLGHHVVCVDIDAARIAMLSAGESPIYEAGLIPLLQEGLALKRLSFSNNLQEACKEANLHIIATGTPSLPDGRADLSQVFHVLKSLVEYTEKNALIVIKSTVPMGTGDEAARYVQEQLRAAQKDHSLNIASNPEFLREGSAIADFLNAERIVVGGDAEAIACLREAYQPLIQKGIPFITMERQSAELAKYAANAFLALKISYINHMAQLAETCAANIDAVREVMALDPRIGPLFLNAGIGYGGSCFPKDVRALMQIAEDKGLNTHLLQAIDDVNHQQKHWIFKQVSKHFKQEIQNLKIGFWGLAFKPGTDDLREASSLVAMNALLEAGAKIMVYDPMANQAAELLFSGNPHIHFCATAEEVLMSTLDALIIATEWPEFKDYSLSKLQSALAKAPIFDGRNCFDVKEVQAHHIDCYYSVGRPCVQSSEDILNGN